MSRIAFCIFSILLCICAFGVFAAQNNVGRATQLVQPALQQAEVGLPKQNTAPQQYHNSRSGNGPYSLGEFHGNISVPGVSGNKNAIFWLFIQSLIIGLLAVFTPYVYTIHPFTTGYLARNTKSKQEKIKNALIYALSLIAVFSLLGVLVSLIIKFTGLRNFTEHWIFNVFFFRIFITLGISFLGAFNIKLPASWINAMAKRAESNDVRGIFSMAITLPGASFSSTFPMVGLVLLLACNVSIAGPVIGLCGFAVGLSLPFVFPGLLDVFVKSKSLLNNIKVIMGFFSLMIALKFLSKADVSLGYHLIERDIFIMIWMGIWAFMGIYMLGLIKLANDTEGERNIYGQDYLSLSRLFIAITSFTFALYLLPGIWGAPLHGVSKFLPM